MISSQGYLALSNPYFMGFDGSFLPFIHKSFYIVGLISVGLSVYFMYSRQMFLFLFSMVTSLYVFIYSISANSRFSVVYLVCATISYGIFSKSSKVRKILTLSTLGFVSVMVYILVLIGRGNVNQGILAIYGNIASMNISADIVEEMIFNIFQGGLIFAEGVSGNYPLSKLYTILSFSPFPSFIDSFSTSAAHEAARINIWTPLNAFGEVYHMGFLATVTLWVSIFFWIRYSTEMQMIRPGLSSILVLIVAVLVTVLLNQYAVRTS